MLQTARGLSIAISALALIGCASVKNERPRSIFTVSYRDENYVVPEGEIWKLTWESPYQSGEITPAYDVRVLGQAYTSRDRGTALSAYSSGAGCGLLDVGAGKQPAVIWVGENTEFYIANCLIKVNIEAYRLNHPED